MSQTQTDIQRSDELIRRIMGMVDRRIDEKIRTISSGGGVRADSIVGNISYTNIQQALGEIPFEDLSNVPDTLEADKWLAINSAGNAVIFVDPPDGTTLAIEDLTNVPDTLVANKVLQVNSGATAIEFVDLPVIPDIPETIQDLTNVPDTLVANKLLKVNVGATAIEFIDYPTIPSVPADIQDLDNVPELVANKWLKVNSAATAIEFADDPTPVDPGESIIPGRYVMTDVGGTEVDYQLLPDFLDHPDSPPSSAGTYDDEFSSGSVAAAWKWVNPHASTTAVVTKRRLIINKLNVNSTSQLVKTVSGGFTVTAPISIYAMATNFEQGGLSVGRGTLVSDVYTSTKNYAFSYTPNANGIEIYKVSNLVYDGDISTFITSIDRGLTYFRIVYDSGADTLKFYISYEGVYFHHLTTRTGVSTYLGGTPNYVGYHVTGTASATNDTGIGLVSGWFRSS